MAIDLDGTLLNSAKEISENCERSLRTARKMTGVRVVIATARPPRTVMPFYSRLGLDTPMINYNGALVHEPQTGRIILHRPMEAKIARGIALMARKMFPDVLISAEILDNWYTDRVEDAWYSQTARLNRQSYTVAPLGQWLNQPITRLLLLGRRDWLDEIQRAVRASIPGQTRMGWSENFMLQIVHPSVGKQAALATVAAELGVSAEQVMAIGDNANDAGMIKWAGTGVAMGNASPDARSAADHVTDDNDNDGAANAISRFIVAPATKGIDGPDL